MILKVREIGDTSEDGARWPVPSSDPEGRLVDLEDGDGDPARVSTVPVTGVLEQEVLPGGAKSLSKLVKVTGFAYITDARLIVAVQNFDKGSTYVGFGGVGAAVGLAATGISKARAAHRRKGKVLVGHVRWQWAKAIAAQPAEGKAYGSGTIRAVCETSNGTESRLYRLDLTVPHYVPPLVVARECIQRAAAWRLARFPGREDGRARIRELTQAPMLDPPGKGLLAAYSMPNYFYVSRGSAYPKPASGTEPALPVMPAEPGTA
jgi:hypothetical protein